MAGDLTNICSVCGGNLRATTIVYPQVIGSDVSIVNDVPGLVCVDCGEQYLSPDTVDAIQLAMETG